MLFNMLVSGSWESRQKRIPNLADFIYEDGLKAVKPQAVNVIR